MTGTVEEDPMGVEVPVPTGWTRAARDRGSFRARSSASPWPPLSRSWPARSGRSRESIVATSGVSQTFVGVSTLAVATSFPELVASLSAVRLGAFDLAVGNLFGSNANKHGDARDRRSRLHPRASAAASPRVITAGVGGDLAHGLAAVIHGKETRIKRFEPDALLLLLAYGGSVAVASAST
jgi:hypothetical protein